MPKFMGTKFTQPCRQIDKIENLCRFIINGPVWKMVLSIYTDIEYFWVHLCVKVCVWVQSFTLGNLNFKFSFGIVAAAKVECHIWTGLFYIMRLAFMSRPN